MNNNVKRQVVLDTETTGMNKFGLHYEGHKIIEIGAVEIIDRRLTNKNFHVYLKPNRIIDPEAFRIHGITNQFLEDKPIFSEVADELLEFIKGSELIIHNASFDLGFLNYEYKFFNKSLKKIEFFCKITDTLKLARTLFPGQRNSLDALCERYSINKNNRVLHNALIDAELLSSVFLFMTGGQTVIEFSESLKEKAINSQENVILLKSSKEDTSIPLKIIYANNNEKISHKNFLDNIQKINGKCMWYKDK